ncbi:MAG TPA: FkbM family methyltransferase [Burkholderiales bacterium]|nr:FkbM family methyltransferase [Burkholderiales bacterium]
MKLEDDERLARCCKVSWQGHTVVYATPNQTTQWRAETLFEKEPVTIEWIGRLGPADTLVDVGANVGMYAIWAAKVQRAHVWAFEPESQNYALLNCNVVLNKVGDLVKAYCVALADHAGFSELHLSTFTPGGSCHSLGERVNFKLEPMRPAYSQGCVAATLDELVQAGVLPQPTHIKVDVDGFEHKVIAGARRTVRDSRLRSMLIEVNGNLAEHRALVRELNDAGFRHDPAQVSAAERKSGDFKGVAEYVFFR